MIVFLGALPNIFIASRTRAGKLILSTSHNIRHLISIGDPGQRKPAGYYRVPNRLRLTFDDITESISGYVLPERQDVQKIIDFGTRSDRGSGDLLIHCYAGISRSTAAALAIFAALLEPGQEKDALQLVLSARPEAYPNILMVSFADEILGRNGKLVEVTANYLASH